MNPSRFEHIISQKTGRLGPFRQDSDTTKIKEIIEKKKIMNKNLLMAVKRANKKNGGHIA